MRPAAIGKGKGGGLGAWLRRLWRRLTAAYARAKAAGGFLCDNCRYDYGNACRRPGRPNVKHCPEYRAR